MAEQTCMVTALLDRLVPLWTQPVDSRDDAEAAFREVYADPGLVNGVQASVADLVHRVVLAFLMRGRHVGPFHSTLGVVAPTQREIEVRTIDVLTLTAGVVSAIWVVADDLGLLRQLGAVTLT
jgi:SnoaL-like polyketide cyclase